MSLDKARTQDLPLTDARALEDSFRSAERPRAEHKVGLEHEKLLFPKNGTGPVPYEGPNGVGALLEALTHKGYRAVREAPDKPIIALEKGQLLVSLEPGGQLELSGTAVKTAYEAHRENVEHVRDVLEVADRIGLRVATLGYRPVAATGQMPWMPKTRYQAMRDSLGPRGKLALDMMLMTATGQVSLDWESEEDCARKVQAVARLAPAMVALFANSPVKQGAPSGYASYRSRVWADVDAARCGYLPSMIDGSFSYRAYVEWALDAPLLFLRRGGHYLMPKLTFRELLAKGFDGQPATTGDWTDHLSTLFPEVRLKRVMEIRGADCVSVELTGALPALWRGVLYDPQALREAEQLAPKLSFADHLQLHEAARRDGLRGVWGKTHLLPLARELVTIARRGLERLDPRDAPLLQPLAEIAESGRSPWEALMNAWDRNQDPEALVAASEIRLR
jgi:glutamate--cysteine ligase